MVSTLPLDISPTIGAWFIGAITSVGLLGVTTLQCWMYYSNFPRDPVWLKTLVASIWCLEAVRTTLSTYAGYYYAILQWGNVSVLLSPIWSMVSMVPLTTVVALPVHFFFAHQVRSITQGKYRILYYIIVAFSLGEFGFGIASFVTAVLDNTFGGIVFGTPSRIATTALCCAMVTDWTITATLVSFLRKNKTARARALMQILIIYAVNFGLLISLTDLVVLIITNVKWSSVNLYQVSLFEIIGNFYANTMLASLNSRTLVAEHLYTPENVHFTSINATDLTRSFALDLENGNHHGQTVSYSTRTRTQTHTIDQQPGAVAMDHGSGRGDCSCTNEHKGDGIHGSL